MSERPTPETDNLARGNHVVPTEWAEQLERERNEAREALKHIEEYGTEEINAAIDLRQKLASALVERDEAIRQRNETNESSVFSCNFYYEEKLKAERERNEIQEKCDNLATEHMLAVNKLCEERDEAREQVKELIYIAERAIDLAELDFENDKFGVVSELRDSLQKIKEGEK